MNRTELKIYLECKSKRESKLKFENLGLIITRNDKTCLKIFLETFFEREKNEERTSWEDEFRGGTAGPEFAINENGETMFETGA